ncbi:MAG: hypothetical protein IKB53_06620, partial [Oscillospiraceae bacterium]|nr:hypothetical protein [Oscillospiraceae bacterium]
HREEPKATWRSPVYFQCLCSLRLHPKGTSARYALGRHALLRKARNDSATNRNLKLFRNVKNVVEK